VKGTPRLPLQLVLAILAPAVLILASCSGPQERPLVVWSNVTDVAFAVERYNLLENQQVHFKFVPDLAQALTQERSDADLVIGRWVNTPIVNRLMVPVESYRQRRNGTAGGITNVDPIFRKDETPWVPLSYNLPAFIFTEADLYVTGSFGLTLERLETDIVFTDTADGEPPPVFAPSADPAGLYALYRSLGYDVTVDDTGSPRWSTRSLTDAMNRVRSWQERVHGGSREEGRYVADYLYDPPRRQLENRRIGVVYGSTDTAFDWSFLGDRNLGFRWLLRGDGRIPVHENIVYAGIPRETGRRDSAVTFLQWITTPSVQVDLVSEKIDSRIDTFGFLEGFSTVPEVNTELSRTVYPKLRGRIPAPEALAVPGILPRYWNEAVEQVVAPFLVQPESAEDLTARLERWYRQRGD
jgi:hypothetical protein